MDDARSFRDHKPPWVVFPHITPQDLSAHLTQGTAEQWFDHDWRPFWSGLSDDSKAQYLEHWHASPEWREALAFFFDSAETLDVEADARESEAYLAQWRAEKKKGR